MGVPHYCLTHDRPSVFPLPPMSLTRPSPEGTVVRAQRSSEPKAVVHRSLHRPSIFTSSLFLFLHGCTQMKSLRRYPPMDILVSSIVIERQCCPHPAALRRVRVIAEVLSCIRKRVKEVTATPPHFLFRSLVVMYNNHVKGGAHENYPGN
jgi:hypothetical protein